MNNYEEALRHLESLLDKGFDKVSDAAYDLAKSIDGLSSDEIRNLKHIGSHAYDICEEIEILRDEITVDWYL